MRARVYVRTPGVLRSGLVVVHDARIPPVVRMNAERIDRAGH